MARQSGLDVDGPLHRVIIHREAIPIVRLVLARKLAEKMGIPLPEITRQLVGSTSGTSQISCRKQVT